MIEVNIQTLGALVLYLIVILGIGFWASVKIKNHKDYYMGGKKLPGWALAFSERSTDMSAWLVISVPALAYTMGVSALWIPVGCYIGSIIQWIFYSKKLREERDRYDAITAVDYLAKKHSDGATVIRILGAVVCFMFFIFYVAAQFAGGGKVLGETFGFPMVWGMVITAIIIIVYCIAGGFLSVVWTDVAQALLMVVTLVVVPIVGLVSIHLQGLSLGSALASAGPEMTSWTGGAKGAAAGLLIGTNLSWIFGYLGGEPHFFIRQMAIRSEKERKTAIIIAIVWGAFTTMGAWLLGAVALTLFGQGAVADPEGIMPYTVLYLMPPFVAGVLLAGVIAGMMSTADSQLVVASSAVSEDLYHDVFHKGGEISERKLVWISRIITLVVGVLAFIFAYTQERVVYILVSYGWAGLAGAFVPSITLSLWWKKFSKAGVYAAFIVGIIVTIAWIASGLDTILTVRIASFAIPFPAAVIASLLFPKKEK
jgi:sodium/proline symporter